MSKVTAIILACCLLFLVPIKDMADKQDAIVQSYVSQETTKLIDAVRNNGYLTADMYDTYLDRLDKTGNLYTIEIVHKHEVINPIYNEDTGDFLHDTSINYYNTYNEGILTELYEGSGTYQFNQGDYVSIKLYNKNRTFSTSIQRMLSIKNVPDIQIYFTYGGMIRDENY